MMHTIPLRFSALRHLAQSPAHYRAALLKPFEPTPAMRVGTLIHAEAFDQTGPLVYEGERRGKSWSEFKLANPDTEIVTRAEADRAAQAVVALRAALLANPEAMHLLTGTIEHRFSWMIGERQCIGTPDVYGADFVTDLKSTANAEPGWFGRFALRAGHASQLVWYGDGLRTAGLADPKRYYIVAVEQKAPHAVTCFELTDRAIELGRKQYRTWLEQLLVCEASDSWPAYAQSIVPLDAPDDDFSLEWNEEHEEETADTAVTA